MVTGHVGAPVKTESMPAPSSVDVDPKAWAILCTRGGCEHEVQAPIPIEIAFRKVAAHAHLERTGSMHAACNILAFKPPG